MSNQSYLESDPDEEKHFIKCCVCHEMIDMRDLTEVFEHEQDFPFHGKPMRDAQYSGSKRIK